MLKANRVFIPSTPSETLQTQSEGLATETKIPGCWRFPGSSADQQKEFLKRKEKKTAWKRGSLPTWNKTTGVRFALALRRKTVTKCRSGCQQRVNLVVLAPPAGRMSRMPSFLLRSDSFPACRRCVYKRSIVTCRGVNCWLFGDRSFWEYIRVGNDRGGYPPLEFVLCHVPCPRESPEKGGRGGEREGGRERGYREGGCGDLGVGVRCHVGSTYGCCALPVGGLPIACRLLRVTGVDWRRHRPKGHSVRVDTEGFVIGRRLWP